MRTCYQVNLQPGFGGGETYTVFFAAALARQGVRTVLFAHRDARDWTEGLGAETEVIRVPDFAGIAAALPREPAWLVFHTAPPIGEIERLRERGHYPTAIVHMPQHDRDPARFTPFPRLYAVSAHVRESLRAAGLDRVDPEPLYGVADLRGRTDPGMLRETSCYDWDRRKLRDRLLGIAERAIEPLRHRPALARAPGIVLGVVSRLTTIKQFPQLFSLLSPVIAEHPAFHLDIFGAGGYASVRDLRRALAPIRERVRFCGAQRNVGAAYRSIDYLLTGLPEKEALGLNVIEAIATGCPVLGVDAPPFVETIAPEATGLLYRDPREDAGRDFDRLLTRLETSPFMIDAVRAAPEIDRFSESRFDARIARLLEGVKGLGGPSVA